MENVNGKAKWVTRTGMLLAVLVALQAATKPFGQLLTGSCVNGVLALSALLVGFGSGAVVAVISPVLAFLLGIAGNIVTIPAIMLGNLAYVLLLSLPKFFGRETLPVQAGSWLLAAAAKFAVLYLAVGKLICGLLSESLLTAGLLKEPMLSALPVAFGVTQLITALLGGAGALLLFQVLKKALGEKSREKNKKENCI